MKMAFTQILVMGDPRLRRGFTMTHLIATVALVSLIAILQILIQQPARTETSPKESAVSDSPGNFSRASQPLSSAFGQTAAREAVSFVSNPLRDSEIQTEARESFETSSPAEIESPGPPHYEEGQTAMARPY